MNFITYPSNYTGCVTINSSKSFLQRAIAIASLSNHCCIHGYSDSGDAESCIRAAESIGARVVVKKKMLLVEGINNFSSVSVINCGESGLTSRIFSMITALYDQKIEINGQGSLLGRSFVSTENALAQLGKNVVSDNHFLPLIIDGKIRNNEITIDCTSTSQVLTGLLIALPLYEQNSIIHVNGLNSKPYIDMTLKILEEFGIKILNCDYRRFEIPGKQKPFLKEYFAEGDWSSAAFHLVGAAIAGEVSISGLNIKSLQADRMIIRVLSDCGAIVKADDQKMSVKKGSIKSFCFDATDCPDLIPPLAVLAAYAEGRSTIMGTSRLLNKESNRAETLKSEFEKLGIRIEFDNNKMVIFGGKVRSGAVSAFNDHRIAMACAILGLKAEGNVEIENAECVNKSYPDFFRDYGLLTKNHEL